MQRRHFIHAATASLLFPGAAKACVTALAAFLQNRDLGERAARIRRS